MTQKQLAELVGLSQSQVSKLLRGERVMTLDQLDAFCVALDVDVVRVVRWARLHLGER